MSSLQVIELFAGHDPSGHPCVEKIQVEAEGQRARVTTSPAFIKGLARGDLIQFDAQTQQFELVEHSGNLSIRVISKTSIAPLQEAMTADLEKLGGQLDTATPRMLVYSIHVSCGFNTIEDILNRYVRPPESVWFYGNVYDPEDGQTPLNWWLDILKPE